jgi:hypothetical protein
MDSLMLAGVYLCHRHHCFRRLPLIWSLCSKLTAAIPSPQLTGAHAQVLHRRRPPEHPRHHWPLRRRFGLSSRSPFLAATTLDTWCNQTTVSPRSFPSPWTSPPMTLPAGTGRSNPCLPLWPRSETTGWKTQKPRGLYAKRVTHRNSALRTPLCYFYCRLWNSITTQAKIIKCKLKFVGFLILRSTTFLISWLSISEWFVL